MSSLTCISKLRISHLARQCQKIRRPIAADLVINGGQWAPGSVKSRFQAKPSLSHLSVHYVPPKEITLSSGPSCKVIHAAVGRFIDHTHINQYLLPSLHPSHDQTPLHIDAHIEPPSLPPSTLTNKVSVNLSLVDYSS